MANTPKTGLLRASRRPAQSDGERYSRRLPQAGAQISSRPESRRQIRRRKVQADSGSLRSAFGHQEAPDVRPVRLQHAGPGRASAPGADTAAAAGIPGHPVRFRRLRFWRWSPERAGRAAARVSAISSASFSAAGSRAQREEESEARHRPRIPHRHHLRRSHARRVEEAEHHPARRLQRLPRRRRAARRRKSLPHLRRHRTSHPGKRQDALPGSMLALRRQRTLQTICQKLRRRRPRAARRKSRRAHSSGRANRFARSRGRAAATPERTAALRAICTSSRKSSRIRFSIGAATICTPPCRSRSPKPRSAPKWKCPRSTAARRCAFRPAPTAASGCACAKRALRPPARQGKRGDQIVEVQIVAPKPEDERVRNLLKELAKVDPEDPRTEIFAKAVV